MNSINYCASALESRYAIDNGFISLMEMEREHRPIVKAVVQALFELRPRVSGGRLSFIDLGCGNGALLRVVARQIPDVTYFGIDLDPQKILRGRSLFPMSNVTLREGNICAPSDEWFGSITFDLILVNVAFLVLPGNERLWNWSARHTDFIYTYAYADDSDRTWNAIASSRHLGVRLDAIEPVVDGGTAIWLARRHYLCGKQT